MKLLSDIISLLLAIAALFILGAVIGVIIVTDSIKTLLQN